MIKYVKSRTMAFTLISFLISLVLAGIIIAAAGYSPVEAYSAMLGGAFGSTYNLAQTAGTAIPLIFAGLAMAVASRAGIFNIGIEGQILAGADPVIAAKYQIVVLLMISAATTLSVVIICFLAYKKRFSVEGYYLSQALRDDAGGAA